jgi:AAA15 family ATPase/GTPase
MIKNFTIQGFRAIGKKKNIELAPITILIGNNGSGKSSLVKAILTYPKLFKLKTIKDDFGYQNANSPHKNVFGSFKQIAGILKVDPTDISGNSISFDNIINKSAGTNLFSLGTKIPLRFLYGDYQLNIHVQPNDDNFGEVTNLEIIDKEKNESFLQIYTDENSVNNYLTLKIKIRKFKKQIYDAIQAEVKNSPDEPIENNLNIDDHLEKNNQLNDAKRIFQKNLRSPFHKQDKLIFSGIEFTDGIEALISSNYSYFKGESAFLLKYLIAEDIVESIKKKSDEDSFEENVHAYLKKAVNYAEKKAMESLAEGINIPIGAREKFISTENFIDLFLSDTSILSYIMADEIKKHLPKEIIINTTENDILSEFGNFFLGELLIKNIQNAISTTIYEFKSIEYIPPYKFKQESFYANKGAYQTIIERLREIKQKNIWFGASEYFSEYWLKHFGIGERIAFEKLKNNQEQVYLVKGDTNLPVEDQGFGLSQLIPIIYLCSFPKNIAESETAMRYPDSFFYMKEQLQTTFLIEEPESNLHPSNQSKLADLFVDAHWKFGHQFIVETHSEYLIRKLQYWVAKGILKNDKIKIISFSNDKSEKGKKDVKIREIFIKSNGDLTGELDSGFFDESIMLSEMLRDIRKNKN